MTTAAEPEVRCRSCGGTDGLTRIFRLDEGGSFYPHAAVCRGCAPVPYTQPVASPAPVKRGGTERPNVTTAIRAGVCAWCREDILPPELIQRIAGRHVHDECAAGYAEQLQDEPDRLSRPAA